MHTPAKLPTALQKTLHPNLLTENLPAEVLPTVCHGHLYSQPENEPKETEQAQRGLAAHAAAASLWA